MSTGSSATKQSQSDPRIAQRGSPKLREGVVVSDKMDKTVVVALTRKVKHPAYGTVSYTHLTLPTR